MYFCSTAPKDYRKNNFQARNEYFGSLSDLTVIFGHIIPVVWLGRNADWETPPKTRVAVSALHAWEIGPGTALKNQTFFDYY